MTLRSLSFLLSLTLLTPLAFAQDQYWNAISLNTSADRYDLYLESEQRMMSAFDDMHTFNISLGGTTAIGDNNSIGLEYRWEDKQGSTSWASENRYSLLFGDSRRFGDVRFQTRYKLESRDKPTSYELRSRLRFKLSTAMADWTPWATVEVMYNHSNSLFNENRYSLGGDYGLTETLTVSGFYLYRRTTGGGDWNGVNVLGTKLSYEF